MIQALWSRIVGRGGSGNFLVSWPSVLTNQDKIALRPASRVDLHSYTPCRTRLMVCSPLLHVALASLSGQSLVLAALPKGQVQMMSLFSPVCCELYKFLSFTSLTIVPNYTRSRKWMKSCPALYPTSWPPKTTPPQRTSTIPTTTWPRYLGPAPRLQRFRLPRIPHGRALFFKAPHSCVDSNSGDQRDSQG
jgi:hypothetical protein